MIVEILDGKEFDSTLFKLSKCGAKKLDDLNTVDMVNILNSFHDQYGCETKYKNFCEIAKHAFNYYLENYGEQ